MSFENLLNDKKTVAVVCNQFGDTGKGKFVDLLAQDWAQIIVRGTGGANAGHTIVVGDQRVVLHQIPSGILHDGPDKINVIGRGVAFNPKMALNEISQLQDANVTCNHLRISHQAHLVLPQHMVLDRVQESLAGDGKIGTTGRGIGPLYQDHYARLGLTVNDLLNKDIFVEKLRRNLAEKIKLLQQVDSSLVHEVMHHEAAENGRFYHQKNLFAVDAIVESYLNYGRMLQCMICDTDQLLRQEVGTKRILLEGAQGLLLSVDYGTYPYVTSSDSSVAGLVRGAGLSEKVVDLTLGLAKGFYMTRVGAGPFPTELTNPALTQQIRERGQEFGATTGRPRRIGWLDLPLLRYARQINGPDVILTKIDVLDQQPYIQVCDAYHYEGSAYWVGQYGLQARTNLTVAWPDSKVLAHCQPILYRFPGWCTDTSGIRTYEKLPTQVRELVEAVENMAGVRVRAISVGKDREQTIVKD